MAYGDGIIERVGKLYEWADRKYRLSTMAFLVALFAFILTLWWYCSAREEIEAHHEEIAKLESRVADYEGCRNPTPSFNPPLRINFSDGRVARVSYSVSFMPVWEKYFSGKSTDPDEERLHQLLHNRTKRLNDFLQGKVYSELEVHAFNDVTHNRTEISRRILEEAKPLYDELDYEIMEFNLWEICEVRSVGTAP